MDGVSRFVENVVVQNVCMGCEKMLAQNVCINLRKREKCLSKQESSSILNLEMAKESRFCHRCVLCIATAG